MPIFELPDGRLTFRTAGRLAWFCVRIAAGVSIVVVPFGYVITGVHKDVLMGAGSGLAFGIVDWLSFAFFTALARDYMEIIPVSVAARALVGSHLILSIGWGLVVFAAVMSYIQPQIERISLREKTASDDQGSP